MIKVEGFKPHRKIRSRQGLDWIVQVDLLNVEDRLNEMANPSSAPEPR